MHNTGHLSISEFLIENGADIEAKIFPSRLINTNPNWPADSLSRWSRVVSLRARSDV